LDARLNPSLRSSMPEPGTLAVCAENLYLRAGRISGFAGDGARKMTT
jgi:hypothetical protein